MTEPELRQKMIEFWDQPNCSQAKYERIVTNEKTRSTEDEAALEQLWQDSVQESLRQILHGVQLDPAWSVLEIGAGIGRLLLPLSKRVSKAYGVDISPAMVEYAQEYLKDTPNASVFLNDGSSLSMFESEMFDFCFSVICFQHIPDVEMVRQYLQEIARVLRPNGLLRIQVRHELSVARRVIRAVWHCDLGHLRSTALRKWHAGMQIGFEGNRYTRAELQQLLSEQGLQVVDWQEGLGRADWLWVSAVRRPHNAAGSNAISR